MSSNTTTGEATRILTLDEEMKPLDLTEQEKANLLALLYAFEGEGWMVTAPIQLPADP